MIMNENKHKLRLGDKSKGRQGFRSNYVKPSGKFWKRYFNKKVRKGEVHKRGNWFEWC